MQANTYTHRFRSEQGPMDLRRTTQDQTTHDETTRGSTIGQPTTGEPTTRNNVSCNGPEQVVKNLCCRAFHLSPTIQRGTQKVRRPHPTLLYAWSSSHGPSSTRKPVRTREGPTGSQQQLSEAIEDAVREAREAVPGLRRQHLLPRMPERPILRVCVYRRGGPALVTAQFV
jgi:hypothetical protein